METEVWVSLRIYMIAQCKKSKSEQDIHSEWLDSWSLGEDQTEEEQDTQRALL